MFLCSMGLQEHMPRPTFKDAHPVTQRMRVIAYIAAKPGFFARQVMMMMVMVMAMTSFLKDHFLVYVLKRDYLIISKF